MIVLGIDTSAVTCSVALYSDHLLSFYSSSSGLTHSQTLLPAIRAALEENRLSVSDLDLVAISNGPGSFTGLRIGISTVKGLCLPNDISCVGVSTLNALAMNARGLENTVICPVMDARRGEFYNALFLIESGLPKRITPDRAISGEELKKEIASFDRLLILGDGAEKFCEMFPEFQPNLAEEKIRLQNGESVALLGMMHAKDGNVLSCKELSPTYLRLPQAEREWQNKNKK